MQRKQAAQVGLRRRQPLAPPLNSGHGGLASGGAAIVPVVNLVAATVWQVFGLRSAAAAGGSGRAKSWQYSNLPVGAVRSNATIRRGSGFEIHLEHVHEQNPLILAPDP